ncbi:MAG: hypothetical protein GY821_09750 [Gammaproteobacteria bacterium]|nr:hypothetical protein [Gammaproteobacteria bacterium]
MEEKHDGNTIIDEIKSDIEVIAEKVKGGNLYCLGNMNAFHTEEALKRRDKNFDGELGEAYGIMRDKANDVDNKLILKFSKKLTIVRNAESNSDINDSIINPDEIIIGDDDSRSSYDDNDLYSIKAMNGADNSLSGFSTGKNSDGFWSFSWIATIWYYFSGKKNLNNALDHLKSSFQFEPEEFNRENLNDAEIEIAIAENNASSIGYRLDQVLNSKGEFDKEKAKELFKVSDLNELMEYSDNNFHSNGVPLRCQKLKQMINAIDEANGDRKEGVTKYGVIDKLIMTIYRNNPEFSPVDADEMIAEQNKEKKEQVVIAIEPPQHIEKESNGEDAVINKIDPQQQMPRNTTQHMKQLLGNDNYDIHTEPLPSEKSNMTMAPDGNGWLAYGGSWLRWGADKLLDTCCYGTTRRDHADDDDVIDQDNNTITI